MPAQHKTAQQSADSYYEASRRYVIEAAPLRGAQRADVVVIGGGITGASTALHLAEQGVDVALLEARHFGWGASGRSGGQIIAGYSVAQDALEKLTGMQTAQELWRHSLAALEWTRKRIHQHKIQCDLSAGYLHVAVTPRQARELRKWAEHLTARYGYALDYLEGAELRRRLGSALYSGAVVDPASGHLHPLNYCLGLTQAAAQAGARLYSNSAAARVESSGAERIITTEFGAITCRKVVYACNAYLERLQPALARMIMPVGTYIIATEPLEADLADSVIPCRAAVADTNLVLDYYRLSADNRMLFGGRVSYSTLQPRRLMGSLRKRMCRVFPQLARARVDFAWGGHVAITRNRAPHIGRLNRSEWFAHGFSGHGMALTGYVGGLLAEAALSDSGDSGGAVPASMECFRNIPHKAFVGGPLLRAPILVADMACRHLLSKLGG